MPQQLMWRFDSRFDSNRVKIRPLTPGFAPHRRPQERDQPTGPAWQRRQAQVRERGHAARTGKPPAPSVVSGGPCCVPERAGPGHDVGCSSGLALRPRDAGMRRHPQIRNLRTEAVRLT